MTKKDYRVWLTSADFNKLKDRSREAGFEGRGFLGNYLSWLVKKDVIILDSNTELLLKNLAPLVKMLG